MRQFNSRIVRRVAGAAALSLFFFLAIHELAAETPFVTPSFHRISEPIKHTIDHITQGTKPENSGSLFPGATLAGGNPELLKNATAYIDSIMNPANPTFERLACPNSDYRRYHNLRPTGSPQPTYLFAINLRESIAVLPTLLGSIIETIRFLGPKYCALSIVEGHSKDGTFEVLNLLRAEIESLGARYYFQRSDIDPSTSGDRIGGLAALRNLALKPLTDSPNDFAPQSTIIFLNDVSLCPEDILELVYQKQILDADMTCGFDWTYVGQDPTFYDVWIARTLAGDSFFEIPPDGNWNSAWNLFWNAPDDRARFGAHKPFQVFSCWNGAAVFSATPLIDHNIRFRAPTAAECFQGEPQLFCKDLWRAGYHKIAVVPSVNLEYDDEHAAKIKALKGYVSQWAEAEAGEPASITWQAKPPDEVKCMASYATQEWRPWNEGS
ncbi:hypothetical protein jhhlp_005337 [Lomentospora prolificans]|uniref:Alpha-1,3-mannosyltransferase CMT1 n=1 Tax=Lomentospora prolificans TaxID=41688 RepID=A0A2N3N7I2_9PEZI|nr:hypothetical protein jhhlp_005337 [Lomentospora prolificans]